MKTYTILISKCIKGHQTVKSQSKKGQVPRTLVLYQFLCMVVIIKSKNLFHVPCCEDFSFLSRALSYYHVWLFMCL